MLTPFGKVVAGVEDPVSAPAQEMVGGLDGACGRSNGDDAFWVRYARNCDIVALSEELELEELAEAPDSDEDADEATDELEEAEELAESEELDASDELDEAEELDCCAAALSAPAAVVFDPPVPPPHAATRAVPADKPAKRRKSRR